MAERFANRREAGAALARALAPLVEGEDAIVLALPRGGVPVGYEIARAIGAPLDVLVVRKLGVPWHEELAMGALASGGLRVLVPSVVNALGVSPAEVERVTAAEADELARRESSYREGRPFPTLRDRTVILVDDGLATGASMEAAVAAVRTAEPARVIVAVPVAPIEAVARMREIADDVVCLATPEPFEAVGLWYDDFSQTTDDEVRALLRARDEVH